ncbi:hypothetical protein BOW53_11810 [Solemya pervernicosa gill symbiont]|uniref:ATP synthase subunit I n=1 Tax=Solemya pervernicosa gill symbiont TaxID=642797 RepID=A0A1T2L2S2_9GAMM|nr:hypothetical protein BOW53_11810 [Solemya pervernicosa gill symbiont]
MQRQVIYRQLWIQALLVTTVSLLFLLIGGWKAAAIALYGGSITIINTLLQLWHTVRAFKTAGASPERNIMILYRCVIERYVVTIALFALAVGALKLDFLPLMIGFVVGLMALFFGGIKRRA